MKLAVLSGCGRVVEEAFVRSDFKNVFKATINATNSRIETNMARWAESVAAVSGTVSAR